MLLSTFMGESFYFLKFLFIRKNEQASLSFSLVPTIDEPERDICILLCLFLVFNNNILYHIYILFVRARLV